MVKNILRLELRIVKKKSVIRLSIIAFVIVSTIVLIWFFGYSTSIEKSLEDYSERREIYPALSDVFPDLNTLPKHENIYYQYRDKRLFPFSGPGSLLLVVTYDSEIYEVEKKKLESLTFLSQPIGDDKDYQIPETEFSIKSFTFKVLGDNGNEKKFEYPMYFAMIATSDEKNSIAYLSFGDSDLDYISETNEEGSMAKFVKEYYRYKW